jgi:AbrB family looped-hinge helix DNA binding protein
MAISTVTSKGQVTIPKRIREQLRLKTGDKVDFRIEDDGTIRVYPVARRVSEVFGVFASKATKRYSTSELNKRVEKAFREGTL